MHLNVSLQKQTDEVLAKVLHLATPPVALQSVDHRRRKPIPGASILDEVVHHLVERLSAGLLHPLVQPSADLERNSDADVGQLDRARSTCHVANPIKHESRMLGMALSTPASALTRHKVTLMMSRA